MHQRQQTGTHFGGFPETRLRQQGQLSGLPDDAGLADDLPKNTTLNMPCTNP